jgi:cytochrome c556
MELLTKAAKGVASAVVVLGMSVGVAQADAIADRQETMKAVGGAMKALAAMAKGEAAFDGAAVKTNADTIATKLEAAKALFPDGSDKGEKETWAKAEIWQDKDTFLQILDDGIAAANVVAGAGELDALRPALGELGSKGCKACHEKFRRPKE